MDNKEETYQLEGINAATEYAKASILRRFGTFVIDHIVIFICAFVLGLMTMLIFGEAGIQALQRIPDIVIALALTLGYYVSFEYLWGRTLGKMVFRTMVIMSNGGKPSFQQVVKRTLCRYIPFEPLSFFIGEGWHDSLSKTQVVCKRTN